jgi:hypothetical protein
MIATLQWGARLVNPKAKKSIDCEFPPTKVLHSFMPADNGSAFSLRQPFEAYARC